MVESNGERDDNRMTEFTISRSFGRCSSTLTGMGSIAIFLLPMLKMLRRGEDGRKETSERIEGGPLFALVSDARHENRRILPKISS